MKMLQALIAAGGMAVVHATAVSAAESVTPKFEGNSHE